MRICIDNITPGLSTSPNTIGGMRDYLFNFVKNLIEYHPNNEYIVISPFWNSSVFKEKSFEVKEIFIRSPRNRLLRVIFENTLYWKYVNNLYPDIFVGMCNTIPPFICSRKIFFIKSIQYLVNPSSYKTWRRIYLEKKLRKSIIFSDYSIISSSFSKKYLVEKFQLSNLEKKIKVIHEAPYITLKEIETIRGNNNFTKSISKIVGISKYFLSVGALYKYKKTGLMIRSFASFLKVSNLDFKLIIIGSESGDTINDLYNLSKELSIEGKVIFLGQRERDFIISAYINAELFLFFSGYETFGHPIIEAMMCGCPVLTTNKDLHFEIAGEKSYYNDSNDPDKIALQIIKLLKNKTEICNRKQEFEEWVLHFNWKNLVNEFQLCVLGEQMNGFTEI